MCDFRAHLDRLTLHADVCFSEISELVFVYSPVLLGGRVCL